MSGKPGPLEERFWEKVARWGATSDECWEWRAARTSKGYGKIGTVGGFRLAHRVSWTLVNGPIPDELWVLHHCDNPPCVNPAHLFLGTARDNIMDAQRKGRMPQTQVGQSRKTHCKNGHPFTPANILTPPLAHPNYRNCRKCNRERMRARTRVRV